MALVDLAETKIYLRIDPSDTSQDDILNLLIASVDALVKKIIGDIEQGDKTEEVNICEINNNCCGTQACVLFKNIQVTEIKEINGQTYNGVLWTDYFIREPNDRKVCFNDLSDYTQDDDDDPCYVTFLYESWYASTPSDLKLAVLKMIAGLYAEESGKPVTSYKVWDVAVTFANPAWQNNADASYSTVNSILSQYQTFTP